MHTNPLKIHLPTIIRRANKRVCVWGGSHDETIWAKEKQKKSISIVDTSTKWCWANLLYSSTHSSIKWCFPTGFPSSGWMQWSQRCTLCLSLTIQASRRNEKWSASRVRSFPTHFLGAWRWVETKGRATRLLK